jgi:hypothetical protein
MKEPQIKRNRSIREGVFLLVAGIFAYMVIAYVDSRGLDRKWATAVFGTIVPFGFVIYMHRQRLRRRSFWASVFACLVIHSTAIWVFFQYTLAAFRSLSPLLWYPVMLVEMFGLLIAVKRIEEKLTGEPYTMTLRL